jgi:site-specific recombinase XerC
MKCTPSLHVTFREPLMCDIPKTVYQYKREPLSIKEAERLFSVADTLQEKLCVYETSLPVSDLAGLNKQQIQWQQGAIRIKGKGGPCGKKSNE